MSHSLEIAEIDRVVGRTSPGSFALGYVDGGRFIASYVGRSDSDVGARLRAWIGVDGGSSRYSPATKASYRTRNRCSLALPTPSLGVVSVIRDSGYTHFEFRYSSSVKLAFEGECHAYHDFGGSYGSLDNMRHPVPPEGVSWICPAHGNQDPHCSTTRG